MMNVPRIMGLFLFCLQIVPSAALQNTPLAADFTQHSIQVLADSLKNDLGTGDIDFAQLHVIQLQIVLTGVAETIAAPSAERDAELASLKSQLAKAISAHPLKLIDNDPGFTSGVLRLYQDFQSALVSGDNSQAETKLAMMVDAIAQLRHLKLQQMLAADVSGADQDGIKSYVRLSLDLRDALRSGDLATAEAVASEVLSSVGTFPSASGINGENIVNAYDALGRAALKRGDFQAAQEYLRDEATTPGSARLSTFGPNLWLAKQLLSDGYRDTVLQFLVSCKSFWQKPVLDQWINEIRSGQNPTFAPNSDPKF